MATIENIELYTTMVLDVVRTWKKVYEEEDFWNCFKMNCDEGDRWLRDFMEDRMIDLVEGGVSKRTLTDALNMTSLLKKKLETIEFLKGTDVEVCRNIQDMMRWYVEQCIDKLNIMKEMKGNE